MPAAFGLIKGLDVSKVEGVNMLFHSATIHRAAVMLVTLFWCSFAFCGEIHDAAAKGDLEIVKMLLKANPDLVNNKDKNGWTPLRSAAVMDHRDVAEFLLSSKADVNTRDNRGDTPLHTAAQFDYKDMAALLLAYKADVNAMDTNNGYTPLHRAAFGGHKDIAELLLTNKADVDAKDKRGETPLHMVVVMGLASMSSPSTSREWMSRVWAGGYKDTAKLLLANKANVNARDNNGSTPLHYAVDKGNEGAVKFLLVNKADVNAEDNTGITPLVYAKGFNYKDVIDLLRQHGGHE